jgi:hypothetical protein
MRPRPQGRADLRGRAGQAAGTHQHHCRLPAGQAGRVAGHYAHNTSQLLTNYSFITRSLALFSAQNKGCSINSGGKTSFHRLLHWDVQWKVRPLPKLNFKAHSELMVASTGSRHVLIFVEFKFILENTFRFAINRSPWQSG